MINKQDEEEKGHVLQEKKQNAPLSKQTTTTTPNYGNPAPNQVVNKYQPPSKQSPYTSSGYGSGYIGSSNHTSSHVSGSNGSSNLTGGGVKTTSNYSSPYANYSSPIGNYQRPPSQGGYSMYGKSTTSGTGSLLKKGK
jgi:hypothetical protein